MKKGGDFMRKLPQLERLRVWLLNSPHIKSSIKQLFVKDYYHSSLSDIDLFNRYHMMIVNHLS